MQVQLSSGRVADSAKNRLASTENIIITFPAHFKKCDENGCADGSYCSDNESYSWTLSRPIRFSAIYLRISVILGCPLTATECVSACFQLRLYCVLKREDRVCMIMFARLFTRFSIFYYSLIFSINNTVTLCYSIISLINSNGI